MNPNVLIRSIAPVLKQAESNENRARVPEIEQPANASSQSNIRTGMPVPDKYDVPRRFPTLYSVRSN